MKLNEVDSTNFETEVLKADKPVLVDYFGTWCMPCSRFLPTLEKVADEVNGRAILVKLDVDESPEITSKYKVKTIPCLILFKNGEEVNRMVGGHTKQEVLDLFDFETTLGANQEAEATTKEEIQ
jgi:thioredoxin 1